LIVIIEKAAGRSFSAKKRGAKKPPYLMC